MNSRSDSSHSPSRGWTSITLDVEVGDLERWCLAIDGDVQWFDSAIGHRERGQRSMLVLESAPLLTSYDGRHTFCDIEGRKTDAADSAEIWRTLDARIATDRAENELYEFPAGVVGYASYEAAQICDPALPQVPHAIPPLNWAFVLAAIVIAPEGAQLVTRADRNSDAEDRLERWRAFLEDALRPGQEQPTAGSESKISLSKIEDARFDDYAIELDSIMTAIRDGRYYQACLTYPIIFDRPKPSALALYRSIRASSPGDYGGYFRWGDLELACTSPEEFLSFRGRSVRARPMKGTRRRKLGDEAAQANELRSSVKDRAENVMIVDLLRNDLGRSAIEGSVSVERLCEVETYETVLQMTSTVVATLLPNVGVFEAFGRAFPPGSMTGAPKIEACRHLAELETHPRGLYAGSIGWIGYDDRAVFNVVIRSFQAWNDQATWNTGGGIVADSNRQSEWEESRTKASPALSLANTRADKS